MKTKTSKVKELTISTAELSRFGMGVMSRALKILNTQKKVKLPLE